MTLVPQNIPLQHCRPRSTTSVQNSPSNTRVTWLKAITYSVCCVMSRTTLRKRYQQLAIVNNSLSYAISRGKYGRSTAVESRAFLTAVIPKSLSMSGNMETTSQETSRDPAGNGPFAFQVCILIKIQNP